MESDPSFSSKPADNPNALCGALKSINSGLGSRLVTLLPQSRLGARANRVVREDRYPVGEVHGHSHHCTAAYCSCVRSPEDINWAAWTDSMSSMVVTFSASKSAARSWAVYNCSASHHAESVPRRWSDTPALTA